MTTDKTTNKNTTQTGVPWSELLPQQEAEDESARAQPGHQHRQ
jgi:hypothetical protein